MYSVRHKTQRKHTIMITVQHTIHRVDDNDIKSQNILIV